MYTVHYSQHDFNNDCMKIAKNLYKDGFEPDFWIPLDRGGVIAAATIRRLYQDLVPDHEGLFIIKRKKYHFDWTDYELGTIRGPDIKVLVVDDIVDYGTQFDKAKREIAHLIDCDKDHPNALQTSDIKYASLIYNLTNQCGVVPEYYGRIIDKTANEFDKNSWFRFWWEND